MEDSSASNDVEWASTGPTGQPGSLERLCSISLRACQLMNPLISQIYQELLVLSPATSDYGTSSNSVKTVKQDKSAFTIADGLVQRLLIKVLFSQVGFRAIVGEEDEGEPSASDESNVMNDESWFNVQGLSVPVELQPLVLSTKTEIEMLASQYLSVSSAENESTQYEQLTVFIDPIDGTREFSSGKGEQCSVCIGFANEHGKSVGGVVYRPLTQPKPTWIAGVKSEGYHTCDFGENTTKIAVSTDKGGILTSNGSISPFVESLIEELKVERVKSGGAGNKMMLLLERSILSSRTELDASLLYIQDRGVSRWDTCAAEACLEAYGGKLVKLTSILNPESGDEFYKYLASEDNLDFIPGSANLTTHNCRSAKEFEPNQMVAEVKQVKAYANLCGLVAVGIEWNTVREMERLKDALRKAAKKNPPSYN